MYVSKYLFSVPTAEGTVIIRQMMSGGIIELPTEAESWLRQGQLNQFNEDELGLLLDQEFVYPEPRDEGAEFLDNYRMLWESTDQLTLNILPTTSCQLECVYCYEDGICRNKVMTANTEDVLVRWVEDYLERTGLPRLRVIWFGGEPLLCKKKVASLSEAFVKISERLRVTLESQIVTNAVLLDEKVLAGLKRAGLNRVQITLDGPPKHHDLRRYIKKTGKGTFDTVHNAILLAARGGYVEKVDLRVNIDRQNYKGIGELFELLSKDGIQDQIHLSIGLITNTLPTESCVNKANAYFQENGLKGDEIPLAYLHTARMAKQYGFELPNQYGIGPWCIARNPHAWMVGPDGEVYKCLSMVGRSEGVVGQLPQTPTENPIADQTIEDIKLCIERECPMLPICGGGCHFERKVGTATCLRSLLEELNAGLMRLEYSG